MRQNIDLIKNQNYRQEKRMNALAAFDSEKRKIVRLFCKIYFGKSECWSWCEYMSGYMKENICVNDKYYFHIRDVYVALLYDVSYEKLIEWYCYRERQIMKNKFVPNLGTFIKTFN